MSRVTSVVSRNGFLVMDMPGKLNEGGTTILMVTHSEEMAKFSNIVVQLLDGKIVTD